MRVLLFSCFRLIKQKFYSTQSHTMQGRFLTHFRSDVRYKYNVVDPSTYDLKHLTLKLRGNVEEFRKMLAELSNEQLPQFLYLLSTKKTFSEADILTVSNHIDEECCTRLESMRSEDVLKHLDGWMYCLPNRITDLVFYSLAMNRMKLWFPSNALSLRQWVLCVFYVGLGKNYSTRLMKKALVCVDHKEIINSLSFLEICVILNAVYKSSTHIDGVDLPRGVTGILKRDLETVVEETALFTTAIKFLRQSRYHDFHLMDNIAKLLMSRVAVLSRMNFTAKVHLLAMFADSRYYPHDFISVLTDQCLRDLSVARADTSFRAHLIENTRLKDITRFLWSVSFLGCDIDQCHIEKYILPQITHRIVRGDYKKHPEDIIVSLLSLWMLGSRPVNLIEKAVPLYLKHKLEGVKWRRRNSRLCLLMYAIKIENPDAVKIELGEKLTTLDVMKPNLERHLERRPLLQSVYSAVQNLAVSLQLSNIQCGLSIPQIYSAGITARAPNGANINIEVLDSAVCLHKSSLPDGLMKFKLHLLEALGYTTIIMRAEDLEMIEDTESMYIYVEDEIRKVVNSKKWKYEK